MQVFSKNISDTVMRVSEPFKDAYLEPSQTSQDGAFCENSLRLEAVNSSSKGSISDLCLSSIYSLKYCPKSGKKMGISGFLVRLLVYKICQNCGAKNDFDMKLGAETNKHHK